jgi:hypothetical protein
MERPLALPWRFSARAKCCRTARLEEQSFRLRSRVSGLLWYDYRYGAAGGFVLRMSLGALGIVTWPPTIPFISGETYNACFSLQCFVSLSSTGILHKPAVQFHTLYSPVQREASNTYSQYRFPELRSYSSSLFGVQHVLAGGTYTKSATAST